MTIKHLESIFKKSEFEKAIIIAIIIGICIAIPFIYNALKGEDYSSLYLLPDSYTNYPEGSTTSFIYGVKSFENVETNYDLEIFIGDISVKKTNIMIKPGDTYEKKETIKTKNLVYPIKVSIFLKSPDNIYSVHYWLKNSD
ncbi:hypothetical protein F1737_06240 [Methanoplanus sp. FWC-SCC4]|uniref:DUF1616 domain-containing protein n=1 Tax=Methanochimaera problematica TaxID=2609417 RepID=A0AA97FC48_9EURY|nr:hypothetical protein [Methanoplanus sp. FWC-SCC4]WOF16342.1 hypothetical protein F1737_06240 [Methanoplanus sp. FWC-SCC4]